MKDGPPKSRKLKFPDWQLQYETAVLEFNESKRLARVDGVKALIEKRRERIKDDPKAAKERVAIEAALFILDLLKGAAQKSAVGSRRAA